MPLLPPFCSRSQKLGTSQEFYLSWTEEETGKNLGALKNEK